MKKLLLSFVCVTTVLLFFGGVALAIPPVEGGQPWYDRLEKKTQFVNLYPKYCGEPDWSFITDSAWGRFKFSEKKGGISWLFNGHNSTGEFFTEGGAYSLVVYWNDWPDVYCLGTGTVSLGDIHIKGFLTESDFNTLKDLIGDGPVKVWLVPGSNSNCSGMGEGDLIGWDCEMYLFEHHLIGGEE